MGSARTDDVEDGNAGVLADRDRIVVIMPGGLVATTTLHAIALDLHAFIADLEWTVNAYTLPFAVLPMAGCGLRRTVRPQASPDRWAPSFSCQWPGGIGPLRGVGKERDTGRQIVDLVRWRNGGGREPVLVSR